MRIGVKMKKWISILMCLCMLVQNAPVMAFASTTDNLCEHHPKHTEDCGYVEAVAGSACTHKHSEACYKIVDCKHTCSDECGDPCTTHTCTVDDGCITMERDCHHVHGECGYAEAVEPQDCTTCQPVLVHAENCGYVAPVAEETCDCVPGEDGTVTHIEGCGYVAPVEEETCDCKPTVIHGGEGCTYVEGKDGSPCTHVCAVVVDSADSCYKLLCSHKDGGHDDACGYAAAVEGHACHYECSACEADADDEEPEIPEIAEGVCAHGNSEESCETCVGEIQVMINALPDMEDIGDHNRADVISQLEAIDDRKCKLSDDAKGKLDFDKYVDAAFVLSAPEGFFGFLLTKRYEAGASAMPQASFAFLDASGAAATVITPEEQQTTSVEPVSNGGAVRGYLPVGEYTLDETVVGDWNLTMTVNGQAEGDHTFTGEGGRAYRIETVNTYKPCEHTTENAENKATCKKQAVCDLCGESYGEVNKNNHDASEAFDNGFCPNGCYESAELVDGVYQISNAGQLYWFAEQVNFDDPSINGKLMDDILVNENVLNSEGTVSSDLFRKWYPIGSTEYGVEFKYSGTFNGNGKTISGLYFDDNNEDGVGLFGYVDSGKIQNVGIKDSYFNGNVNVGSVVAHNYQGTVTGCYNTGTVSGGNTVGGVVGKNEEGTVTDCYNSGRIGSRVNNVGGVLGGNIGTVSGCYNTGSISGQDCVGGVAGYSNGSATDCYNTGKVDGNEMVGGVLGLNESGSTLSNCYNTGEVNGQFWVGGVLGLNHVGSKLINCYNTGEVGEGFYIGGVLGRNERGSTLINCYNTGEVIGSLSVGGVAGENDQGTIAYCYYLTGSTTSGIGEGNGTTEGKTAEAFASGEVAYLLGVPFGQNIDNDQTKQAIPCFSNEIVYLVENCNSAMVYSNTNGKIGHKWENGKCRICGTPCPHNSFDSTTGECSDCKTDIAEASVKIGKNTTYYKTLAEAVNAAETGTAEAPATLTLLMDIDLDESYQRINSGVMTLDLNGCTLEGTGPCVLYISGTETHVTINDDSEAGTITNTGTSTTINCNGVHASSNSNVTITGGTISASDYGVYANNSTVTINGGKISGEGYDVYAENSTVTINGGTVTATGEKSCGVYASSNSAVKISGGTISTTGKSSVGVNANNSTVTISGGEVSSTNESSYGVYASGSTVTIEDGTISGTKYGVDVNSSTVTISGGDVSGEIGVNANNSTVTITGGSITGVEYGMVISGENVTASISGGTITSTSAEEEIYAAVHANQSTVTITGGEISGAVNDLREFRDGSITLTLAAGATEGATFPNGLTVYGTTLVDILGERAAYWQNDKMLTDIDGYSISGTVTVEAECEHENATYPTDSITNTQHKIDCSCGYKATEDHTFDSTTGKCSTCGAREIFFEANVSWNKVCAYYWDNINDVYPVKWPGVELTKNDDGMYHLIVPGDTTHIIFNGGSNDNKTDDLTLGVDNCYHYDGNDSYWYTYPCTEHTWEDGKCSNCQTPCPHNSFDSDTGQCTDCKTDIAEASVKIGDTTTRFKTLAGAVDAAKAGTAEAPATLTLLKNINLGESSQWIDSGVFTLDLNGCTLAGIGDCVLHISGVETHVTITDGSDAGAITNTGTNARGVIVSEGTLTIENGTISSTLDGVYVFTNSTVYISGGSISGTDNGVFNESGTVEISGGTIAGEDYDGVTANNNSTVKISGGTITGSDHGVYASSESTVEISGGTITGTGYGVYANESTVEISGGEISATGENSIGVYAEESSEVEISGGTITGTKYGVNVWESTVTIKDGTITGTESGVHVWASTVTISGGEISGVFNDLRVVADDTDSSITLTLAAGATEGATFPEGLTVYNTTLDAILAEGAAYWQEDKMIFLSDGQTEITGGTVTVKKECKHTDVTYPAEHITDTHHTLVCSCGYVVTTEPHTLTYTASSNVITASCSKCKAPLGTAIITANGKTYNGEPVTAAVQTTGALTDSNIGITYSQNGEELNESAIRAGTYTASIKLGDAVAKVDFTITPATLPNAVLSETGYTYNGQQQKPEVTVTDLTENTDYTVTYPQDVTNAGEKTVTITGKGNYTGTVTKSYSIAKADSAVTKAPQAAANLVYNGKNQNLVIAGTVTGGTLQYSLDGKTWAARIPVGKAAGTYTVSYKVVGDGNHKDIAVRTLAVTIAKGTAPAVDALVQTHFYAYATANTVDLAKYLPADRGTTAYTAVGVSADIFSIVPSVTNAGVLSYTTRKLTAAPASDTQIRIKAVMENYADAELTVTVKLLAVTEQTQQKIVKAELTEVPAGLAGTQFHSVDAIKTEQKRVLDSLLGYDPQGNIIHHDVKLQFSPDGGKTWVDATKENFPANGLTVTLPYPSGTGKDTHNFVVSHMFTTGAKAGTIETPAITKTAEGIRFTVTSLSPVSVAWSAIPFDVKVANVTNGTVCVSSAQAAAGTQVTITATPKSGYRLSTLTVKDAAGNFCVVSTDNNGKYYFTMPAADVTVTATFTAKSTAVADTTNPKTGDDCNLVFWNSMAMTSLLALAVLMLNKKKLHQK